MYEGIYGYLSFLNAALGTLAVSITLVASPIGTTAHKESSDGIYYKSGIKWH